ncbi:MAG: SAM-dependent methyltransferase [marine bacterium B5-7]|nr:MAG: SAM-dependent methyltransferase [marine bacterium B5-7]
MTQNIYDEPEFFAGYSQLERSERGLDGAPEWPAIRDLIPDLSGKVVVDLGCGFGWFARWAREAGAARVLALDVSENMIARARQDTHDPGIDYRIADLNRLSLPDDEFDLAYSSLAFHYIEDFDHLVENIRRGLRPNGQLVFSIEHPIYMAPEAPGWIDLNSRKTWPVNQYLVEGQRVMNWLADGVIKYHRTIGTTLNSLIRRGFAIDHVLEWRPVETQIRDKPALTDEMERPMILVVKALRLVR